MRLEEMESMDQLGLPLYKTAPTGTHSRTSIGRCFRAGGGADPTPCPSSDLENVGSILTRVDGDLIVSKRRMRKAGAIQMVRQPPGCCHSAPRIRRRPFVLCGLPIRRPGNGTLLHERRNGHFFSR